MCVQDAMFPVIPRCFDGLDLHEKLNAAYPLVAVDAPPRVRRASFATWVEQVPDEPIPVLRYPESRQSITGWCRFTLRNQTLPSEQTQFRVSQR